MNTPFRFVSALLRSAWLMEPSALLARAATLPQLLSYDAAAMIGSDALLVFDRTLGAIRSVPSYASAPASSLAVLHINHELTHYDQPCGEVGMATLAGRVQAAAASPQIAGLLVIADSPGGQVDGTEALAETLHNFGKPTATWVSGSAASAMYWIAAATDRIWLGGQTQAVGSIGVQVSAMDVREMLKREGITLHHVTADGSEDKNAAILKLLDGEYADYRAEHLNPIRETFVAAVRRYRGDRLSANADQSLSGRMYYAADAVAYGLVDGVAPLTDAINDLYARAGDAAPTTMFFSTQKLSAVLALAHQQTPEALTAAQQELTAAGVAYELAAPGTAEALATATATATSAQAEAATLQGQLAELAAELEAERTAAATQLAAAQAEIERLGQQPGEMPSRPIARHEQHDEPRHLSNEDVMSQLAHNRRADATFSLSISKQASE